MCSFGKKEKHIYVSVLGSNRNAGTKDAPVASLNKALVIVEELREKGDQGFISIQLEAGTYFYRNSINIGRSLSNISICSEEPGTVIFSGGENIGTEWMQTEAADNGNISYRVDLKKE